MGRHSGRFRVFSVCVWFSSCILQKKNHWYLWCNVWRTMFCSLPCSVSSGDTLLQAMDLLPMLIQTVEKAASQSTQIPMVTEGVAAALLICRMSVIEGQTGKVTKHPAESNMNSFWRITFFFFLTVCMRCHSWIGVLLLCRESLPFAKPGKGVFLISPGDVRDEFPWPCKLQHPFTWGSISLSDRKRTQTLHAMTRLH